MQFHHKRGVRRKESRRLLSRVLLIASVVGLVGGIYLLVLVLTPNIHVLFPVEQIYVKTLSVPTGDRVYIPKIGVNVAIDFGGAEALDKGAWHRFPERGDPI